MNRSFLPRHQNRIVRLLVFACFFNFSGLNNGYTYLTNIAPPNANQSVSAMGTLVKSFSFVFSPNRIFSSINHGRRLMTSLTLQTEAALVNSARQGAHSLRAFAFSSNRNGKSRGSVWQTAEPNLSSGALAQVHENYLKEKRSWRQQKEEWRQENWTGIYIHAGYARELTAAVNASLVSSREPIFDEGLLLRKVLRRIVYPDGGDDSAPMDVLSAKQTPGPIRDQGLFLRGEFQS